MGMQNEDEDSDLTRSARHYVELRNEAMQARYGGMVEFGREAFQAAVRRADQQEPVGELEDDSPTGFVITSTPEEQ